MNYVRHRSVARMALKAEFMHLCLGIYRSPQQNKRAARVSAQARVALTVVHGMTGSANKVSGALVDGMNVGRKDIEKKNQQCAEKYRKVTRTFGKDRIVPWQYACLHR